MTPSRPRTHLWRLAYQTKTALNTPVRYPAWVSITIGAILIYNAADSLGPNWSTLTAILLAAGCFWWLAHWERHTP